MEKIDNNMTFDELKFNGSGNIFLDDYFCPRMFIKVKDGVFYSIPFVPTDLNDTSDDCNFIKNEVMVDYQPSINKIFKILSTDIIADLTITDDGVFIN